MTTQCFGQNSDYFLIFVSLRLVRNPSGFCRKILASASRSRTQAGSLRRRGDPTSGNDIHVALLLHLLVNTSQNIARNFRIVRQSLLQEVVLLTKFPEGFNTATENHHFSSSLSSAHLQVIEKLHTPE